MLKLIRRIRVRAAVAGIALLALLTAGCSNAGQETGDGDSAVTVAPVELFDGESAKFEPFLGKMSRAFKLRYEGAKPDARLDLDIWENGKKTGSAGSIGDVFFSGDGRDDREVEVIVTEPEQPVPAEGAPQRHRWVKVGVYQDASSFTVASFPVPWDGEPKARGLIAAADESHTIPADGSVYLWGIQETSGNVIRQAAFTDESMAELEWALVLTLRFDDRRVDGTRGGS